jgi:hypothetical protein
MVFTIQARFTMRTFILLTAMFACALCTAQSRIKPLQLTVLPEQFVPFQESVGIIVLANVQSLNEPSNFSTTEKKDLSFGVKGNKPLNRDLGFNNPTPAWIRFGDPGRYTFDPANNPYFLPDAHGIIPKTQERLYLDAQELQRDPPPKKQ